MVDRIEPRPLTDVMRALYEQEFQNGILRVYLEEDGTISMERAHTSDPDFPCYAPIDLKRGVHLADGEFQITDRPLLGAYVQWLEELADECRNAEV